MYEIEIRNRVTNIGHHIYTHYLSTNNELIAQFANEYEIDDIADWYVNSISYID